MPVQIYEMVIRANIVPETDKGKAAAPAAGEINKEEIIKECTTIILELLKEQAQR